MNPTYFLMLLFVFWCAYLVATRMYRLDAPMYIMGMYTRNERKYYVWSTRIIRAGFAALATFFFHNVW